MQNQYERDLVSHTPGAEGAEIALTVQEVVDARRACGWPPEGDPSLSGMRARYCDLCGARGGGQGASSVYHVIVCTGTFRRVTFEDADRGAADAGGSPTLRYPRTVAKMETVATCAHCRRPLATEKDFNNALVRRSDGENLCWIEWYGISATCERDPLPIPHRSNLLAILETESLSPSRWEALVAYVEGVAS